MAEASLLPQGTVITQKGYKLITKLLGAGAELQFTKAAVGTGVLQNGVSPETLTSLVFYKMDANIADYGVAEDQAFVNLQVSSEGVEQGFLVTEVGIFATDPDEGEILYAYMDISGDPTYIYAAGSSNIVKFAEFTLYVLIGELQKVTAIITPGSFVSREVFDEEKENLQNEIKKKVASDNGDISNTAITTADTVSTQWPVPAAGDKPKTLLGKVKKFFEDFKAWNTGVLLVGRLSNQQLNDTSRIPTSALVYSMQQALTKAQSDISSLNTNKANASELNLYVSKAGVFVYGNTQNCYDLPAGYYSVIRPTKAQNYPEEATEDYPQGVLLILGSVIGGNNEKSYRLFLFSYGDNLYYAYDWWGTVGKWLKITAVKQS